VPRPGFAAGGLHRTFFGATYRSFWTVPLRLGVAELGRIAGGVRAVPRENPNPSRPFVLKSDDGRTFGFRALVKDATLDWPEPIRSPLARKLAQDQISGTIPGGVLAAGVLERAVGLRSAPVQLVVLPDDARLGEWRAEFAGQIGVIEQRMQDAENLPAVPGARELLDSERLFERLRTDPGSAVDARAFLSARLVDFLIGDWDRYEGQWGWAGFPRAGGTSWVPIPIDRDWAFTRLDGLAGSLTRKAEPKFGKFDARLRGLRGLTERAEALDRRLLVSLDRGAWDSVVAAVVTRLDDRVIDAAVAALPPGLASRDLDWLRAALRGRRTALPAFAAGYYDRLAEVVELWGTEGPDRVTLRAAAGGGLTVTVARGGGGAWSRTFLPAETRELRLHTLGGADALAGTVERSRIRVRVIDTGGGAPELAPALSWLAVYDSSRAFTPPPPIQPG
jgi:hypothetical protein